MCELHNAGKNRSVTSDDRRVTLTHAFFVAVLKLCYWNVYRLFTCFCLRWRNVKKSAAIRPLKTLTKLGRKCAIEILATICSNLFICVSLFLQEILAIQTRKLVNKSKRKTAWNCSLWWSLDEQLRGSFILRSFLVKYLSTEEYDVF